MEICTAHWLPLTAVAWNTASASVAAGLLLRTAYDAAYPLVIGDFAEGTRHAMQWLATACSAITAFALIILATGAPQPGSAIFTILIRLMPITMSLAAIVLIIRYVIRVSFQPRLGGNGLAVLVGIALLLPTLWSLQLPRLCH